VGGIVKEKQERQYPGKIWGWGVEVTRKVQFQDSALEKRKSGSDRVLTKEKEVHLYLHGTRPSRHPFRVGRSEKQDEGSDEGGKKSLDPS